MEGAIELRIYLLFFCLDDFVRVLVPDLVLLVVAAALDASFVTDKPGHILIERVRPDLEQ